MFTWILVLCMPESMVFWFYRGRKLPILVLQGENPVQGERKWIQKQAGNRKLRSRSCRMMLLELSITSDGTSVLSAARTVRTVKGMEMRRGMTQYWEMRCRTWTRTWTRSDQDLDLGQVGHQDVSGDSTVAMRPWPQGCHPDEWEEKSPIGGFGPSQYWEGPGSGRVKQMKGSAGDPFTGLEDWGVWFWATGISRS